MPSPDKTVRVFISSTFRDMHAERDHLVTVVFPELRERCERLGLEFFDVDLRWGVPAKTLNNETANLEEANSWEYCSKWIDRVQPFFVCILGQRYGWVPPPEKLKNPTEAKRQEADPRSITDMEVHYAVLEEPKQKRLSYFYLRKPIVPRPAENAPKAAWQLYSDYVDGNFEGDHFIEDQTAASKLTKLKQAVTNCGRPARLYDDCEWKDNAFTGMEVFGKKVLADLWSGVLRDERYVSKDVWRQVLGTDPDADPHYTDEAVPVPDDIAEQIIPLAKPPPKNPLEAEREQMAAFASSRLRWFQGRTKELDQLTAFIRDPAEDNQPRLALIAAVPGQGKSALMAKLWETLSPLQEGRALGPPSASSKSPQAEDNERRVEDNAPYLIAHFVGATEQSSTAYALVKRLNDELDASGISFPERPTPEGQPKEEPKLDFNSLCHRLYERLGDYASERRIVILLDALNQLDDGHELGWLPYRLGPSVRIVVSCIEETNPHPSPLPEGEGANASPSQPSGKASAPENHSPSPPSGERAGVRGHSDEPTPSQKVLTALNSRHPAPLRIPLSELTPDDVRTIVVEYLREYCHELDREHLDTLCAIPQARNPLYLTVMLHELRTLGGNDLNTLVPARIAAMPREHPDTVSLFKWVLQRMEAAEGFGKEAVQWWCLYLALGRVGMASRELADLLDHKFPNTEAHLTAQRIERGLRRYLQRRGETLDFFHSQLRQAVMERYGKEENDTLQAHRAIADYFCSLADPSQDKQWKGEHQRPFNEIASHFIWGEHWDELCDYLTDFRCLDRRVRAGQIFEVVKDHAASHTALPEFAKEAEHEQERVQVTSQYGAALIAYARDCGSGKTPPLPLPPATGTHGATAGHPEDYSPRAARLTAIANFTAQHATLVSEFPEDFLALAANAAADGPLAEAELLANAEKRLWFERCPRPRTPPLRPQCLATLQGHTSYVNSVCLTPDGQRALSGSSDNTLRLWDLQSSQCLLTLQGHTEPVTSVCLTLDGQRALSGSHDNTLRLWNLQSGQCLHTLQGHTDLVESVSITPDGRRSLSGSDDNTLRLWDLESGQCLLTLEGHTDTVTSVCLTPDGRRALSGSRDHTLRLWDLENGQCLLTLQGHTNDVFSVCFTPDGQRALSGSSDNTLRLWDLQSGQCLLTKGHRGWVHSVSLSPNGQRALSGSDDNTLHLWDLQSGQCLQTFQGHTASVMSVCLTSDGRRALSGSLDYTLRLWGLQNGQCLINLQGHTISVNSVCVTPDGQRALSGSDDNTLRVWDLQSGQCLQTLQGHMDWVVSVCLTPDGQRALSGSDDNTLRLWDLESGQCLLTLQGQVNSVCLSPDGQRALSGSLDYTLRLWDLQNGQCLHILKGHMGPVVSVSVTPDGRLAVSGSADNTVRVWDLQSGQCLQTLHEHTDWVTSVCLAPDGLRVLSGSHDKTLRLWDLQSGQCLQTLQGHTDTVTSVSLTSDGRRALSGSNDKTLRLWDLESGQCLAIYHAGASVNSVAVSAKGERIVCGTADGQIHLLTLRNFEQS